jgi:hypothetical protein
MEVYKITGADTNTYSSVQERRVENEAPKQEAASKIAQEDQNRGTNFDQYA